ncbi:MAG: DNA helicase RecQ [Hyphomicrobiales bacterium]|nr:DNA helicase RecQ [Hyphomicrobiales bacterium]
MGTAAHQILHDIFGYTDFRPGQLDIVEHLTQGRNVLVVMPTGAGKSLCYQIPPLLLDRLAIVVSPLVALMDDQVAALRANGVAAGCIHSGLSRDEQVANWRAVASGQCRLLYMSPERLMTERMLAALEKLQPAFFVIDEAHCISKWGASFRPEYEQLAALKQRFPGATIAAFTATADRATREDIAGQLFDGDGEIIVHGFDRPNLSLSVAVKTKWKDQLLAFLSGKRDCAGIVYCLSRRMTEEVADFLNGAGYRALAYHAGQDAAVRSASQNAFMTEQAVTMVATIAFGMGVDKPDIRYVCHLNLPGSMEAYYQEIGRAGRDGEPAETLLLYGLQDIRQRRMFIEQEDTAADHKMREHKRLDALLAYCEAPECRRTALLSYFDEEMGACGNCDNCLDPPSLVDGSEDARVLLAAIADSGEMFGGAHIIDIVCGTETQKVLDRRHERLASFGRGENRGKGYWQGFVRQAVAGSYLSIDIQQYGALRLTRRGREVMAGREQFLLRDNSPAKSAAGNRGARASGREPTGADAVLLANLKKQRLDLARERNVPAYVVFTDATLSEMAQRRPRTLQELAAINGVGPKKLKDFGEIVLETVRGFAG